MAFFGLAEDAAQADDREKFLAGVHQGQRRTFAAPWLRPDPNARLEQFSAAEIEAVHFAIPAGVFARQGTSPFSPRRLPDLIGIKERRYLDASGLVRHRDIGDLMRYAALNQGMDMLARFGDFIPARTTDVQTRAERFFAQTFTRGTATSSSTRSRFTFTRSSRRRIPTGSTRSPFAAGRYSRAKAAAGVTRRRSTPTTD